MRMLMVREGGQPAARVFYISLVFSNVRRVLSQCNTRLRFLYLLNKITLVMAIPMKLTTNRPIRLTHCCTQFKSFWNKTLRSKYFHII